MPWSAWQSSLLLGQPVDSDIQKNLGYFQGRQIAFGAETAAAVGSPSSFGGVDAVGTGDVAVDAETAREMAAASRTSANTGFLGYRAELFKTSSGDDEAVITLEQSYASFDGTSLLTSDWFDTFPNPLFDLTVGVDYDQIPGSDGDYVQYESDTSTFYGWGGRLDDEVAHTFDPNYSSVVHLSQRYDGTVNTITGETPPVEPVMTSFGIRYAVIPYQAVEDLTPTTFTGTLPVYGSSDGVELTAVTWDRTTTSDVAYDVPLGAVNSPKWTLLVTTSLAADQTFPFTDLPAPVTPDSEWHYLSYESLDVSHTYDQSSRPTPPVMLFLTPRWRYWIPGPTAEQSAPADAFSTSAAGIAFWAQDDGPADLSASGDGKTLRFRVPQPGGAPDGSLHVEFPPVRLDGDLVSATLVAVGLGNTNGPADISVRAGDGSLIWSNTGVATTIPADPRLLEGCSADFTLPGAPVSEWWVDSVFLWLTSSVEAARVPPLRLRQRADGVL